jgi:alpha-tubulin suppressor-like RCC1 family protein
MIGGPRISLGSVGAGFPFALVGAVLVVGTLGCGRVGYDVHVAASGAAAGDGLPGAARDAATSGAARPPDSAASTAAEAAAPSVVDSDARAAADGTGSADLGPLGAADARSEVSPGAQPDARAGGDVAPPPAPDAPPPTSPPDVPAAGGAPDAGPGPAPDAGDLDASVPVTPLPDAAVDDANLPDAQGALPDDAAPAPPDPDSAPLATDTDPVWDTPPDTDSVWDAPPDMDPVWDTPPDTTPVWDLPPDTTPPVDAEPDSGAPEAPGADAGGTFSFSLQPTITQSRCGGQRTGTVTFPPGTTYRPGSATLVADVPWVTPGTATDSGFAFTVDGASLAAGQTFSLTWAVTADPGGLVGSHVSRYAIAAAAAPSPSLQEQPGMQVENVNACARGRRGAIAGGWESTVVLMPAGSVSGWGQQLNGAIGNGVTSSMVAGPSPALVLDGQSAATTAVGLGGWDNGACAVTPVGRLYCWGDNGVGQVGNGTKNNAPAPVLVMDIDGGIPDTTATVVDRGYLWTCAVMRSGRVKCWGSQSEGRLGNSNTSGPDVTRPADVPGFTGQTPSTTAVGLSLGENTACALLQNGTIKCWGSNSFGEVGDGTLSSSRPSPVAVVTIDGSSAATTAVSVAHGDNHGCALMQNGTVRCWGNNTQFGSLGTGDGMDHPSPALVSTLQIDGTTPARTAVSLATKNDTTCALMADGSILCWGRGENGRIGNGVDVMNKPVPTSVDRSVIDGSTPAKRAVAVTAGVYHFCAVMENGDVRCWGKNNQGQAGVPGPADRLSPVLVPATSAAVSQSFQVVPQ